MTVVAQRASEPVKKCATETFVLRALSTVRSFDRLRTNGVEGLRTNGVEGLRTNGVEGLRTNGENTRILPFVVSLSNHEPRFLHRLFSPVPGPGLSWR
jgi:hypothetical protein